MCGSCHGHAIPRMSIHTNQTLLSPQAVDTRAQADYDEIVVKAEEQVTLSRTSVAQSGIDPFVANTQVLPIAVVYFRKRNSDPASLTSVGLDGVPVEASEGPICPYALVTRRLGSVMIA